MAADGTSTIVDITTHKFGATDNLLLDANIWLTLYGPQGDPKRRRTQVYSQALKDMLAAQSTLHVDLVVMGEFVNRYARLEYHRLPNHKRPAEFKAFRNRNDFKPAAQGIAVACRKIIAQCQRTESGFTTVDIAALLTHFEAGSTDFNDLFLVELCKAHNWTLVTHDADFAGTSISILTGNQSLIPLPPSSAAANN